MISQTFSFPVSGGVAPYTYQFNTTDTCIGFDALSGTLATDGTITSVFTFENETCINNSNVSLTVVDSDGCSESFTVILSNPCTLTALDITQNDFEFSTLGSGGTPGYSYEWRFNENLFNLASPNATSPSIQLTFAPTIDPIPFSSNISVTVSDSNGCSVIKDYEIAFDIPRLSINGSFVLPCSTLNNCNSNHYNTLQLTGLSSSSTINWDTLTITGATCWNHLGNGLVEIGYDASNTTTIAVQFSASVQNDLGISSNILLIPTSVLACLEERTDNYLISTPTVIQLTAEDAVTDVKTIDVGSKTLSSSTIDWSTFAFITPPAFGNATFNGNQEIEYEITSLVGTTTDTITWSVSNTSGLTVTITEVINRAIIAAPVTIGESVCSSCNNPTAEIDILANDTGDIDRDTVTIISSDPDVSFTKTVDNNYIFTTMPSAGLTSALQYNVANSQGVLSNNSTILISSICAGSADNQDITCFASKAFDLIDYYSDVFGLTYNIAEVGTAYGLQGGIINNPTTTGSVDFTGLNPGTYVFELTMNGVGTCAATTDTEQITITLGVEPSLTIGAVVNNGNDTATINFTVENIPTSNITITDNAVNATFVQPISVTGTAGTCVINLVTGANAVVITGLSNCNTVLTDNVAIAN